MNSPLEIRLRLRINKLCSSVIVLEWLDWRKGTFLILLVVVAFLNWFLVDVKVVQDGCLFLVVSEDFEHLETLVERNLLRVSAVSHRLVLIHLVKEVLEDFVLDVFNVEPFHLEVTCPFVGLAPLYQFRICI